MRVSSTLLLGSAVSLWSGTVLIERNDTAADQETVELCPALILRFANRKGRRRIVRRSLLGALCTEQEKNRIQEDVRCGYAGSTYL